MLAIDARSLYRPTSERADLLASPAHQIQSNQTGPRAKQETLSQRTILDTLDAVQHNEHNAEGGQEALSKNSAPRGLNVKTTTAATTTIQTAARRVFFVVA